MADEIPRVPLFRVSGQESLESPIDRRSEAYRHQAQLAAVQQRKAQTILTLPNVLTFVRLILVPVVIWCWTLKHELAPLLSATVFLAASITDWLDGYLARKMKLATVFGAFLDPVADKIMVSTTLILLTTSPPSPLTQDMILPPIILIICREITMSALREWAAAAGGAAHKAVKVNSLGKWKTALQMVSMCFLLLGRQSFSAYYALGMDAREGVVVLVWLAFWLLWFAAALAIWSLAIYFSNVWTHFIYPSVKHQ